jgi:hypothetical protein
MAKAAVEYCVGEWRNARKKGQIIFTAVWEIGGWEQLQINGSLKRLEPADHEMLIVAILSSTSMAINITQHCWFYPTSLILEKIKTYLNAWTIIMKFCVCTHMRVCVCAHVCRYVCVYIYRVSQEECARLREGVPYGKVYWYNPKHLCPKLNGYRDNGQRKVWSSFGSTHCTYQLTSVIKVCPWVRCGITSSLASHV